jgi:hypothetical protein
MQEDFKVLEEMIRIVYQTLGRHHDDEMDYRMKQLKERALRQIETRELVKKVKREDREKSV